jgi:hypothetical protein
MLTTLCGDQKGARIPRASRFSSAVLQVPVCRWQFVCSALLMSRFRAVAEVFAAAE